MSLNNTPTTTKTHFDYASRLRELDETVLQARKSLDFHSPSNSLRSNSLDNLANALSMRFQDGGQRGDLDEAISLYRQALALRPSPDMLRPNSLNNLSEALLTSFRRGGRQSDLDEAILLPKQALELQSMTDPLRSVSLHNLGLGLWGRFQQTGQQSNLDDSISLHREALELRTPSHPLRSSSFSDLANALRTQFEQNGFQTDLDEAISLHRKALKLRPSPHPLRSFSLNNLANSLWTQFQQKGHKIDLDESILLHRQALELRPSPHPDRVTSLNNLAAALLTQFEQEGHQSDLDDAILLHRQTLEPPISPASRASSLNNLALALWTRFQQNGHLTDLDEAISLYRQILELLTLPHPKLYLVLLNYAMALYTRFHQQGHQSDLDEAILLYRKALELLPPRHHSRSLPLGNLGAGLRTRFEQEGHQSDLDESIFLHRQALELRPSSHPIRSSSLSDLAAALLTRFEREGRRLDLDEVISLLREALDLAAKSLSNPSRSEYLNNLANALQTRFEQEGHQTDLNEAISLHREALNLRILSNPFRSESLNNLANALRARFEKGRQQTDLDEAILLHKTALELRPSPHPNQSQTLHDLGKALLHAYLLTDNNSDYLEDAMESFRAATQCLNQAASLRLRIAHTWIKHGVLHGHKSVIDAYDAALQALPKLAALSFDVKSRQKALLVDSDGLARDASRFAIRAGKVDKAIEFLEAGRAVFWSQFLSLRSPLEQLREIAPRLADKLRDTATALELGSHRNTLADASENQKKLVIDQETARLNRLNKEWTKAIDDVRHLEGFEDFLRPRNLSALQVAASEGPVVILIGNDDGSDILVLTSVNVRTIHLSELPNQELQNLVHLIRLGSPDSRRSRIEDNSSNTDEFSPAMAETLRNWMKLKEERGMRYEGQTDPDTVFRFVLEILWIKVVRPVIDILGVKKSEEPPVVQWCPTGLFSFLPIHAAGSYDNLGIDCASDYFISSYTPTIGALLTQDRTPSTDSFKMMVVIQSQELASTREELENIEEHVSDDFLVKLGIPGVSASVEAVASQLSEVDIVHFSCHGTQDRSSPLDSGLKLEDGYLRVSRIMKEKIPKGALAFLCACETAMGDGKLPDEAMSLGASLLFSGFRRVVATMWAMRDEDGPVIAGAFYEEIFRGPDGKPTREPDVSRSAYALHMAVKRLRAKKVSFSRWVPFIHMGK